MPVMKWRGETLRIDTVSLTLKEAAIVKRFTGLRPGAFQKALEKMAEEEDIDGELMQTWLWVTLRQNGHTNLDITDLEDVTLDELAESMASVVESAKAEGSVAVPDPTGAAAVPDPAPPTPSPTPSTGISPDSATNTSSSSPTTVGSPL